MDSERTTVLFGLVILLNVLWLLGIRLLRRAGYRTSWFGGHLADLGNLWRLSREANDENTRTGARVLVTTLALGLVAFVIILFAGF